MKRLVTAFAASALLILGLATTAAATQAPTNYPATTNHSAATCTYTVTWADAAVYEEPEWGWIKNKRRGQYVEGPGVDHWNGNYWWTAVYTAEAGDGIGWMRTAALNGCGH